MEAENYDKPHFFLVIDYLVNFEEQGDFLLTVKLMNKNELILAEDKEPMKFEQKFDHYDNEELLLDCEFELELNFINLKKMAMENSEEVYAKFEIFKGKKKDLVCWGYKYICDMNNKFI